MCSGGYDYDGSMKSSSPLCVSLLDAICKEDREGEEGLDRRLMAAKSNPRAEL